MFILNLIEAAKHCFKVGFAATLSLKCAEVVYQMPSLPHYWLVAGVIRPPTCCASLNRIVYEVIFFGDAEEGSQSQLVKRAIIVGCEFAKAVVDQLLNGITKMLNGCGSGKHWWFSHG